MIGLERGGPKRLEVLLDCEEAEVMALGEPLDSVRRADEVLELDDRDIALASGDVIRAIFSSGSSTKTAPTWRSSQASGESQGSTTSTPPGSRCRAIEAIAEPSRSSVRT